MTNTTVVPRPGAEVQAAAATVLRMIQGLHISRAVYVAAKLGISDLLADGPAVRSAAGTFSIESVNGMGCKSF